MTATKPTLKARQRGRRDWRPVFIRALEHEGTVLAAARVAGVSRQHVYVERQRNEAFALAWADAEESLTEGLERKAAELAMGGEVKLIEFLLKARRPEKYRDSMKVEHSGTVHHDVSVLADDELDGLITDLTA